MSALKPLINSVKKKFVDGEFDKFIHEVCFPKFKSFAPGARIKFRFPITVLVGPNGGGKSSVLQAAWGMPVNHSTSRFWFSTPVDPISQDEEDPNRYWYSHYVKAMGENVESRKISGKKRHGYWEPSRPNLREGMTRMPKKTPSNAPFMSGSGDRWSQVDRTAHFVNSKAELSAFDRFMNSTTLATLEARQDYFVRYSRQLKIVIDQKLASHEYHRVERVASNSLISADQLKLVNHILQKNYKSARYISHKFYDRNFSPSVIFETSARSYSECFAGSGELAIVNYALSLDAVKPYDLLLLDEPETSLHPGAQIRLIEHLLKLVDEKFVQVLVSTHSATFVENLPVESLVVLDETPDGIAPRLQPTKADAFQRLGQIDDDKITILTEDRLGKVLVDRALQRLSKPLAKTVQVVAADVGASEMLSNQARAYAQADAKLLMVLDGDQSAVQTIFMLDPDTLSTADRRRIEGELKQLHVTIVGSRDEFGSWMAWCKANVLLIDQVCPEQVLLQLLQPSHPLLKAPNATNTEFKKAAKKALQAQSFDSSADGQYHMLSIGLNQKPLDPIVDGWMNALAEKLKIKLLEFDNG